MKNLKNLLKRLNFKNIGHILLASSILWISFAIIKYSKASDDESSNKLKLEVLNINEKIDSISNINESLINKQNILNTKIDSIKYLNIKEDKKYENEVLVINNANISDDSEWFLTKVDSIRFAKKFSVGCRSQN